jgi:HEAT repeat protein
VRLAAGTSLAKLGHDRGEATLERLARSDDTSIRRRTAEAMGEVGSSTFVPTLIGMLDDRLGIRRAALNSLVQIVGRDVTVDELEAPPSLNEQITRWRRWHANQ